MFLRIVPNRRTSVFSPLRVRKARIFYFRKKIEENFASSKIKNSGLTYTWRKNNCSSIWNCFWKHNLND